MATIDSFTKDRDWEQFHTVKNIISSISIEAAELSETVQWSNPSTDEVRNDAELQSAIGDELADVMVYCLRLCSMLNIDPIQIIEDKIEKNASKYPIEYSKGSSRKYTAYEK
ncbi:MAG: nucleotide pyrophosphohydrolase [Euryarchaeota archaeon]|nr:nucleotide pyrophosphohydrolase [Euryarchaeota archaeon]